MRSRFLLCCTLLIFASCSTDRSRLGPVVRAEEKRLTASFDQLDTAGTHAITLRFEYPEVQPGTPVPLADSLRRVIALHIFSTLEGEGTDTIGFDGLAGQLQSQYQELREEFAEYATPWELTRRGRILSDSAGIVSIRFDELSYLGGAHGMETSHLFSLNAETGQLLRTEDLFVPGSTPALAAVLEMEFRRVRQIANKVSLAEAGFWVEEGEFPVTPNFALLPGELLFYYAPYEVGPYAVGPTELRIPIRTVREILLPDGIVR